MKLKEQKDQLKSLTIAELNEQIVGMRKELLTLRMQIMTTQVKDYSQFNTLRKNIARALTLIRQKSHA